MALWAIAGGNGFLGTQLARRLLATGERVRTLDLEPPDPELAVDVDWRAGDVRAPHDVDLLCSGADVVVHAAAVLPIRRTETEIRSVALDGVAALAAAAATAGAGRMLFVSSAVVYGRPAELPLTERTPPCPFEPYGRAKLAAEGLCAAFRRRGLDTVVLRPTAFVGPGRLGVFGLLFRWIREGRRVYTLGAGTNRYPVLAVDDLVDAIALAATRPIVSPVYALGPTRYAAARAELAELIAHAGSASRVVAVPAGPARAALAGLDRVGLSPLSAWHYRTAALDFVVDPSLAQRELGWEPRSSSGDALAAAYDWFAEHGHRRPAGTTHRSRWDERGLALLRRAS